MWFVLLHIRWAQARHLELKVKGSSLEFRLHKLKYLDLLKEGRHKEALEYSKQFARFASDHTKGKKSLMFCDDRRYHMYADAQWYKILCQVLKHFSQLSRALWIFKYISTQEEASCTSKWPSNVLFITYTPMKYQAISLPMRKVWFTM